MIRFILLTAYFSFFCFADLGHKQGEKPSVLKLSEEFKLGNGKKQKFNFRMFFQHEPDLIVVEAMKEKVLDSIGVVIREACYDLSTEKGMFLLRSDVAYTLRRKLKLVFMGVQVRKKIGLFE